MNRGMLKTISPLLAATLALGACAQRSSPSSAERASELVPETWSAPTGKELKPWLESIESEELDALLTEALSNNFGLEAARQGLLAAEAAARIASAARLPALDLGALASRQRALQPLEATTSNHSISLDARWEIDLWNRLGKAAQAERSAFQAQAYELEAFKLSLSGQVAQAWLDAIEAQSQSQLAAATALSFERKLQALESRYRRGLADSFDLRLTRAQAAASQAAAAQRKSQSEQALRLLETLLGRYPSGTLEIATQLPALQEPPPAGLPSALLARRPDLLASERELAASFARNQVAQRQAWPSLVLTASGGAASPELRDVLNGDLTVWSALSRLSLPLFHGGRLNAQRQQAEALYQAQVSRYKAALLGAFQEVETALQAESDLSELEQQSMLARDESALAQSQAWDRYERGLIDITSLLDAERRFFEAQSQVLKARNQRLQNRIRLYLALGGGFEP